MSVLTDVVHQVGDVLAASPTPSGGGLPDLGSGQAPPGSDKIVQILKWGLWAVSIACVAGVLLAAGRMAVQYRTHGGGGEAMTGLVWTLVACVVAGSATAVVGALI
ncbi:MAG: hypothetical protein QG597_180 [Actinomycetota bacterium]|nr:hypothetical protein [Actinomycetota bacterium]